MGHSETKVETERPATKRPYATPRLRHLGSVRELTLGGTMGKFETTTTRVMML